MKPIDNTTPVYAIKLWSYGGITGINDYLMSDGTIKTCRPSELPIIPRSTTQKKTATLLK